MRSTNKDNALDSRIGVKSCAANNQTVAGIVLENVVGDFSQSLLSHCLIDCNYLVVSKHPTHAMADYHVRLVIRIKLVGFGQFVP